MARLKFKKIDEYEHQVTNRRGEILGNVMYYGRWKQWVWEQLDEIVMSWDCLQEVVNYMKELPKDPTSSS